MAPIERSVAELRHERDVLAAAQSLMRVGAWEWDLPSDRLWWSDQVYALLGLDREEVTPTRDRFLASVHAEDRQTVRENGAAALAGSRDYDVRHRIVRPDGEVRHVRERATVVRDPEGAPTGLIGMLLDVTEDTLLHAELAESEARFRLLAENAYDVIWTMSLDGTFTYVSPAVERMRGFTPAEAMAQTLEEIHPPASRAVVIDYFTRLHAALETGAPPPTFHGDQEYYRKDGSIMLGALDVIPQVDDSGRVVQILGVTRDVTERRAYELALERQARLDVLTGLLSRSEGLRHLNTVLSHPGRAGGRVAIAFCDLDAFKDVNDRFGHAIGDAVLRATAERITKCVRSEDLVIRIGGDEILVVLTGVRGLADAVRVAEKIRTAVASPVRSGEVEVCPTVSIGVTVADELEDTDAVVARADGAMYEAKSAGRNRVVSQPA